MELSGEFESYDEWQQWAAANASSISSLRAVDVVQAIARDGVDSPVFGKIPPADVAVRSTNYRESIVARGMNSRQRALVEILARQPDIWGNPQAAIYAAEAVTPLALFMRGRFNRFVGSEYTTDAARRASLFPIAIEDLNCLSFPDECFDCTITSDVLEHVPSIARALSELRRVTKPGGLLLATFPFTNTLASVCKSELINGKLVHHMEPEYHGNPVDPKGSLVFTVPGWDVLQTTRNAGFRVAKIVKYASIRRAIVGAGSQFIDILYARA